MNIVKVIRRVYRMAMRSWLSAMIFDWLNMQNIRWQNRTGNCLKCVVVDAPDVPGDALYHLDRVRIVSVKDHDFYGPLIHFMEWMYRLDF